MLADRDESGRDRHGSVDPGGGPAAQDGPQSASATDSDPGVRPGPRTEANGPAWMRPGSGHSDPADEHRRHPPLPRPQLPRPHLAHPHLPHIPRPQLIEPEEDRWKWRARIRRDPRKLFFYRIGVGVAGLLLMVAAAVTGPLPGPGGIPLFLLGLAVWSSEFEWANKVMGWFKRQFHRYQGWTRRRRLLFWLIVIVCAWAFGYLGMLIYGIPGWLPEPAKEWLLLVPGLRDRY